MRRASWVIWLSSSPVQVEVVEVLTHRAPRQEVAGGRGF